MKGCWQQEGSHIGWKIVFPKSEASSSSSSSSLSAAEAAAGSEREQVVEYFGQEATRQPIGKPTKHPTTKPAKSIQKVERETD